MRISRRGFMSACGAAAGAGLLRTHGAWAAGGGTRVRRFNASVSIDAFENDPALLGAVRDAGVDCVWVASFFHGRWHPPIEKAAEWHKRIQDAGMRVGEITIPLGHPSFSETPPDYMPNTGFFPWQRGVDADGRVRHGVTHHPPATELNVEAVRKISALKPEGIFLDDDFRLAPSPGQIGGCFCDVHKEAFLKKHGYGAARWDELLDDVRNRRLTKLLRAWLDGVCDELTDCFKAQCAAADVPVGNMVMYLGSEQAGIRLPDYTGVPFRVGELMFSDASFAPVNGKTNELFSALFHRRFTAPELAYSESTAWPPDGLSAKNMAAKLVITTLSDVRNTMFMSGLSPFPRTHWETLGPAMKEQAAIHEVVAGHVPRGPFKHYWGEHSRLIGDAKPFSLFLASGVPFEVTETPAEDGWTFLADFDARAAAAGELKSPGTTFVCRPEGGALPDGGVALKQDMAALFEWRQSIRATLGNVPIVEEEVPTVCAWYPTARAVLLWNATESQQHLTLTVGNAQRDVTIGPLGTALLKDIPA